MWDGVHTGHRFLIDHVRALGAERSLVPSVVTFRVHPLTVVRPEAAPPLLTDAETRLALLDAAGVADCVLLDFDSRMRHLPAAAFLEMLKKDYGVDTLVVGFNNRFGHDRLEGLEAYRAIGAAIGMEVLPAPEFRLHRRPVSSSAVRRLLAEGKVKDAAAMLGRRFTLTGTVVSGKQLGRTIGYPTANIEVAPGMILPAAGAYACIARTPDGMRRPAMVNIGRRPTVDLPDAPLSVEAHIIDYAGTIYGEPLTLEFVSRLRDEKAFDGVEALRRQLGRDASATLRATRGIL